MARSVISKPTMVFCVPLAFCACSTSRPRNSVLFQPTIQPRSASITVVVLVDVVAVQAHRGFEAQRVARAEAGRDQAVRLARLAAARPTRARAIAGGTITSKPSSPV